MTASSIELIYCYLLCMIYYFSKTLAPSDLYITMLQQQLSTLKLDRCKKSKFLHKLKEVHSERYHMDIVAPGVIIIFPVCGWYCNAPCIPDENKMRVLNG